MSLRIRRVQIRAATAVGTVGADLEFNDGLNVVAAPNTSGKSTCMMSMLYALGLEGMLGPSHQPPLADAVQTSITIDKEEVSVVGSQVRLEIENHLHEFLTVQRAIAGPNIDRHLIRCVMGPDLSKPSDDYERRDFYVRMAGAAQNEAGFHRYLAEFMGLALPRVPGTETESVPLYLECLIPFFFVDQLTGWRDIKSRMPTHLRIPEMAKRATEYILSLDVLQRAIERQTLELRIIEIKNRWTKEFEVLRSEFGEHAIVIRGFTDDPPTLWPPTPLPQILVTDGQNWITVTQALHNLLARQTKLVEEDIPKAEGVTHQVIDDLQKEEEKLSRLTKALEESSKEVSLERAQVVSINKRLVALAEDYRKYLDLKKLLDRGGEIKLEVASSQCPYCFQEIKDALLPQESSSAPMTLEENIAFLKDQIATFSDMRRDALEVLEAKERQVKAIENRIHDSTVRIKALKRTLHSDGRVPSYSAIQEHLKLDELVGRYQEILNRFQVFMNRMEELVKEWVSVTGALKNLADNTLSDLDHKKLRLLAESFVDQLRKYNFGSFAVEQISINELTYRPSRKGYDIGMVSASDTIRIIWSYLIAMLEVDRKYQSNHLGLLIFDEPRQQGAEQVSFDELMRRAAESIKSGQQVIVATSESKNLLEPILKELTCAYRYIPFEGKIIQRIDLAPPSAKDQPSSF